ncbi:hypothetical protein [Staphylococcus epidermidis]|nr:hypothetical protein [Staphylococcus epidermidis]
MSGDEEFWHGVVDNEDVESKIVEEDLFVVKLDVVGVEVDVEDLGLR